MTGYDETVADIVRYTKIASGVPVYHSPAVSAGEKVIYRCSPGKYDGEWERFTVTMRFISRDIGTAFKRAREVSRLLCGPGDRSIWEDDGCAAFIVREEGGGSGYIGRTGHFFVLTRFEVKRRMPSSLKTGEGNISL